MMAFFLDLGVLSENADKERSFTISCLISLGVLSSSAAQIALSLHVSPAVVANNGLPLNMRSMFSLVSAKSETCMTEASECDLVLVLGQVFGGFNLAGEDDSSCSSWSSSCSTGDLWGSTFLFCVSSSLSPVAFFFCLQNTYPCSIRSPISSLRQSL